MMYKTNSALNNHECLKCHKSKPNQTNYTYMGRYTFIHA